MASEDTEYITIAEKIIEYCLKTVKSDLDDRVGKCMKKIEDIKKNPKDPQIFNDPIHGSIKLNSLEQAIINTPEFFRLKDIKQLGGVVHVYPGATHTRFEHSIGVCYIAGEYVRHFKRQLEDIYRDQPENPCKDVLSWEDENCIRIAALCHDLGHGPFSHLFRTMMPKSKDHEELSQLIFKKILLDCPEVLANFIKLGLKEEHVQIIEAMIDPKFNDEKQEDGKFNKLQKCIINGKMFKLLFLYEIVANKESGMDVDKWDYFARDCHYLGLTNEFDWRRCMELSEIVCNEKDELHIGFREKELNNIYGMFRTRSILYQKAYQHHAKNGIEMMIKDILKTVEDVKMIKCGRKRPPISMKEAVYDAFGPSCKADMKEAVEDDASKADLAGYIILTDTILDRIMQHRIIPGDHAAAESIGTPEDKEKTLKEKGKKLAKAKELIKRIQSRDVYEKIAQKSFPVRCEMTEESREQLKKDLKAIRNSSTFSTDTVEIELVTIGYASEKRPDPVQDMYFFEKEATGFPKQGCKISSSPKIKDIVSQLNIPQAFAEHVIRLYSKMEAETEMRKPKEAELKKLFNDAMKQVIKEEMASDKNQEGQSKD